MKFNRKNNIDISGLKFRYPTFNEIEKISIWYSIFIKRRINLLNVLKWIMCVAGFIVFSFLSVATEIEEIIVITLLGGLCFYSVYSCVKSVKDSKNLNKAIQDGEFLLKDGYVKKYEASTKIDCTNVWFQSNDGLFDHKWFRVRDSVSGIGVPLLLMYLNHPNVKEKVYRVFTSYMLSPQGIDRLI